MKKSLLIILGLFIFLSCNDMITESPTVQAVENLNKKPTNKPNEDIVPMIETFSIGTTEVITSNVVVAHDIVVDLTEGKIPISFSVSNAIPINLIRIRIYYDANMDGLENWNMEFNGRIYNEDFRESGLTEITENYDWNGNIEPIYNDPVYGSDFGGGDYLLKDQLATIYTDGISLDIKNEGLDKFGIRFEVWSGERGEFWTLKNSTLWIKAPTPSNTCHIKNITFVGTVPDGRNKVRPVYHITVLDDGGSWVDNATVYASFSGLGIEGSIYRSREYLAKGVAILKGPALKLTKSSAGDLTLSVKSINKFEWTYNPFENENANWINGEEPSITVSLPEGVVQ